MNLEDYAKRLKEKIQNIQAPSTLPKVQAPLPDFGLYPEWALEIGCGVGLHPILYSKANPKTGLIALERTVEKFSKFQRRQESHQLKNLWPVHADGLKWLSFHHQKLKGRFETIYLLYPNPYPKNTQRNKRFLGMAEFIFALDSLKDRGKIVMRSNERTYLDEARYLADTVWQLECIEDKKVQLRDEEKGITHFERKYLERGLSCYEVIWVKK